MEISQNKIQLFLKTALWNSIIEVFKAEKNIDITEYLISVKMNGFVIFVKTSNPLINAELLNLDDKIKERFGEKMGKIGVEVEKIEIKYI